MPAARTLEQLSELLHQLIRTHDKESEWVEFKCNKDDPAEIGEYISALSNSAALCAKPRAFLVWGVDDKTHEIVGTVFDPKKAKQGNEELESWLVRLLSPKPHFIFHAFEEAEKSIVILEIDRAAPSPIQFRGEEFIRIGSYKKPLKGFPEKEKALWRVFDQSPFEGLVALPEVLEGEVLSLLDHKALYKLLERPEPVTPAGVLADLEAERMIAPSESGRWNITNLGAVLFATKLDHFPSLKRKAVRVITYKGDSKVETAREVVGGRGYAAGFEGLIAYINGLIPSNEVIGQALRKTVPMYPELAIRELVANALIHQDFFVTGAGPMVEIFASRMEVTNPGKPLGDTERLLDQPPRSRNETLASFMRRVGICEERGTGLDKVVSEVERYQLPPLEVEEAGDNTRAILFAHKEPSKMDKTEKVLACYQHAVLRYLMREPMTNSTMRARFGISEENSATASRIIRDALDAGKIKPKDAKASKKHMSYVPYWA